MGEINGRMRPRRPVKAMRKIKSDEAMTAPLTSRMVAMNLAWSRTTTSPSKGVAFQVLPGRDCTSRAIASTGAMKANEPPWMMGSRSPKNVWSKVMIPLAKKMVLTSLAVSCLVAPMAGAEGFFFFFSKEEEKPEG